MLILVIYLVCLFVAIALAGLAGLSDIKGLTIPNSYSVYMVGVFMIAYAALYFGAPQANIFGGIVPHLLSAFVFFIVTFILFALNVLGAGDSKFGAACALWVSLKYLPIYLFFMTLFGGILAIVTLYIKHKKPFKSPAEGSWIAQAQSGIDKVPYGVAIGFGAVATFVYAEYLSPTVLASF
jgi:prepilin peptidase CpaA